MFFYLSKLLFSGFLPLKAFSTWSKSLKMLSSFKVKWEQGFACFFYWENGIWMTRTKNNRKKFEWDRDLGKKYIGNGIRAKFGLEMGFMLSYSM